jgi:hypothetical protein
LNFQKLETTSLYITVIFWVLALVVLLILTWITNKIFPSCIGTLFLLPFKIIKESAIHMFSKCFKTTPPTVAYNVNKDKVQVQHYYSNQHLQQPKAYPTLPLAQQTTHPEWTITKGPYNNSQMTATITNNNTTSTIFYSIRTSRVYDETDKTLNIYTYPTYDIIQSYMDRLVHSPPPTATMTSEGNYTHNIFPLIFYTQNKIWRTNDYTSLEITGILPIHTN